MGAMAAQRGGPPGPNQVSFTPLRHNQFQPPLQSRFREGGHLRSMNRQFATVLFSFIQSVRGQCGKSGGISDLANVGAVADVNFSKFFNSRRNANSEPEPLPPKNCSTDFASRQRNCREDDRLHRWRRAKQQVTTPESGTTEIPRVLQGPKTTVKNGARET